MAASAATLWKYSLLILAILITGLDVFFITWGVVALGSTGSVSAANIVALLGLFVIIVSLIGWMASVRSSFMLSKLYVITTIICVVLETIFMITLTIRKDTFMEKASRRIEKFWNNRDSEADIMNTLQIKYECCGKDSFKDYLKDGNYVPPISCCYNEDCAEDKNIYPKGCSAAAAKFFDAESDNLMLVTVGLVALQALSIIAAYYLIRSVKHRIQRRERIVINE